MTVYARGVRKPKEMHGEGSSANNGAKQTSEYRAWRSMFPRCYNPNVKWYSEYGGRGIKVCKRWHDSYRAFLEDMGRKPTPAHTLERKDNDGDYEPRNVMWATRKEQARNTRNVERALRLTITLTLLQWSELSGVPVEVIRKRIHRGWAPSDAIRQPRGTWLPGARRSQ